MTYANVLGIGRQKPMKNEPTLVELTPGFKRELTKMITNAGIPNCGRFSVQITIEKPSQIEEIMVKLQREHPNGE
jgi:hypothetical protein